MAVANNPHGFAIMAIPAAEDPVWKISSEKVPHMTMLFLGNKLDNLDRVVEFIGHVASTSMNKFYLDVDRRGVLGSDSADVLFFGNYGIDKLKDVRTYLLGDPNISKAYNSTEQYPEWTPHMTLGYPETPAKPDTREFPTLNSVVFDRIALWTGDYEGVEFPLKTRNDHPLSMSDMGEEFLEHYGIKGMKWGIRRDHIDAGAAFVKSAYLPSADAKKAKTVQVKAKLGGVHSLNNHEMSMVIRRMELEQRYRDLYGEHQLHDEAVSKGKRWSKKGARWTGKFVEDVLKDSAASWLKRPGSNASGRTSAAAWQTGQEFARTLDGTFTERKALGK